MDLRVYYRKVREVESGISAPFVVLASIETPEGGRPGRFTEAPRRVAAKLITEGRARVASEEETRQFHEAQAEGKREADAVAAAQRMQVTIVPQSEYRGKLRGAKE